jgi:hypothetical protein
VRFQFRDPVQGGIVHRPVPEPQHGQAARILGWQADGTAVVALYHPREGGRYHGGRHESDVEYWAVGEVELIGLKPGGGRVELVDLPSGAKHVDVPADLLDRFGAPGKPWPIGLVRSVLNVAYPFGVILIALLTPVVLIVAVRFIRNRRRVRPRHASPPLP